MLLLTLPGTPSTYYGEELGMENVNITASRDPAGKYDRVKSSSLETGAERKCSWNDCLSVCCREPVGTLRGLPCSGAMR